MTETTFEILNKNLLWLLLAIPLLAGWYVWRSRKLYPYLALSSTAAFRRQKDLLVWLRPVLYVLRLAAIALLIVALARPREVEVSTKTFSNRGIDIVMAVDVSGSMLARDLKPNRLEALKKVATEFVAGRAGDRIGVVSYAGESFTQTPLTTDKDIVTLSISRLKEGLLDGGTGIGMGLGTALNRLRDSKTKSKVIILLTDGINNDGFLDPVTAADMAADMGIKVYTIGLGTNGMAETPYAIDPMTGKYLYTTAPVEIDEKLLQQIADKTGGKYFRATDNRSLKKIYDEIDKLEKSKIEDVNFYNYDEMYRKLVIMALILLGTELLLRNTVYRSFV